MYSLNYPSSRHSEIKLQQQEDTDFIETINQTDGVQVYCLHRWLEQPTIRDDLIGNNKGKEDKIETFPLILLLVQKSWEKPCHSWKVEIMEEERTAIKCREI